MPKLQVHTKFTLRADDGSTTDYPVGQHTFTDKEAEHWYVKLHAAEPKDELVPALTESDTAALGELEAELKDEAERLAALAAQLDKRSNDLDARDEALGAREADLAGRIEAFEAAQRAAAEQSAEKSNAGQSKQAGRK